MAYMKKIFRKSRTLNTLGFFTVITAVQPFAMDVLASFGLSPKWVGLSNLVMIAILAYLRFKTTGPVGST